MSSAAPIPVMVLSVLMLSGCMQYAIAAPVFYSGYPYADGFVPSGMITGDDGWSHGSLFSAPNWLLAQMDPNLMSTVLDYGYTPIPTEAPKDFEDYIAEGFASLEGGNYRAANTAFKKAIELQPSSSDAWYGNGLALESQKRYLSALDAYGQAISYAKGAGSNWASYAGKGRVLYSLNRFSEAKTALETAISQYEKAGVSHPDELEEMYRLLEEISGKSSTVPDVIPSAYIPATAYNG